MLISLQLIRVPRNGDRENKDSGNWKTIFYINIRCNLNISGHSFFCPKNLIKSISFNICRCDFVINFKEEKNSLTICYVKMFYFANIEMTPFYVLKEIDIWSLEWPTKKQIFDGRSTHTCQGTRLRDDINASNMTCLCTTSVKNYCSSPKRQTFNLFLSTIGNFSQSRNIDWSESGFPVDIRIGKPGLYWNVQPCDDITRKKKHLNSNGNIGTVVNGSYQKYRFSSLVVPRLKDM